MDITVSEFCLDSCRFGFLVAEPNDWLERCIQSPNRPVNSNLHNFHMMKCVTTVSVLFDVIVIATI